MPARTRIQRIRAALALTITSATLASIPLSAAFADPIPEVAQVRITSVRTSTPISETGGDPGELLTQLEKVGATVTRSAVVTITDRTASTIDLASNDKSHTQSDTMAILLPRFNADGSVTMSISVADTEPASSQQLSAVRTFHSNGMMLAGRTEPQSGETADQTRTWVFVTMQLATGVKSQVRG